MPLLEEFCETRNLKINLTCLKNGWFSLTYKATITGRDLDIWAVRHAFQCCYDYDRITIYDDTVK